MSDQLDRLNFLGGHQATNRWLQWTKIQFNCRCDRMYI